MRRRWPVGIFGLVLCAGPNGYGQEDTRAAAILAEREEKSRRLAPDEATRIEKGLLRFRDERWIQRLTDGIYGVRARFGGMADGAGFGIGPEYRWGSLAEGKPALAGAAQTSLRGFRKYDLLFQLPPFAAKRLQVELYAVHHDYPSLSFYGTGADSNKAGRSGFSLEDTAIDAIAGFRPFRRMLVGSSVGYVASSAGAGRDARYASTDLLYPPEQAEGIGGQTDYLRVGSFVQYDYRDHPAGARRGGNYFAQFSNYRDQTLARHGFRRLDVELQQYVPVLNERHAFAFRAKSVMTFQRDGRTIPFYFQPALGGSDDLRGYRPYRFRDRNMMVFNAEYRWEVFSGLDMALFADAGKVTRRVSQFSLGDLESDVGFGFRFNARNSTFLRLDVGFSHEGFQVSVKFSNLFRKGLLRSSSSQGEF